MVLVLCIGDLHIPHRRTGLPAKFKTLLVPGKIHHILCPGNLCTREVYEYLRTVCTDVIVTRGDFDENTKYPDEHVLEIEEFKVVPWGDMDALARMQRRMDVDILVTGHTCEFKAYQYEDRFLINPGSATGAPGSITVEATPSFVLMDISGTKATVYVYELVDEELKVDKIEFSKASVL